MVQELNVPDNQNVTGQQGSQPVGPRVPGYQQALQATDTSSNAGLAVFTNPVQGHVDTGVQHDGDLGGAG